MPRVGEDRKRERGDGLIDILMFNMP